MIKRRIWREVTCGKAAKTHLLLFHYKSLMANILKNNLKRELCNSLTRSFGVRYTLIRLRQQQLFTDVTACLFTHNAVICAICSIFGNFFGKYLATLRDFMINFNLTQINLSNYIKVQRIHELYKATGAFQQ